ncbi:Tetratricopeptide repeat domain containing protein [Colletotrichum higginsianum IMI 349063]|uniref:Tetratricopeptide repeat domain containing protein n=1 Tax=Colletotrichum higginsianum (strain IMI 349063) TaxID=759273 RepID=A0A1B7XWY3_COLHI|nr:Tetratricopeptide repeat domain containing protein [Colletotrichum higginsianum IMI 349063]OBR04272.1 Tetratricopeptide repeat domain containing protein [Colletotrichum higginsianum IMI 349063]
MEISETPETWPSHAAPIFSDTKTTGHGQAPFYPTHLGAYADSQTQPHWEEYEGLSGARVAAVPFHEYYHPINGLYHSVEELYPSEALGSSVHAGCLDEPTLQPMNSAVVSLGSQYSNFANPSQLAGCYRTGPYPTARQAGGGTLGPEQVADCCGQPRHWEVSAGLATCSTWISPPPSTMALSSGSCSPKDMCIVTPRRCPFPEHQLTAHAQASPPHAIEPVTARPSPEVEMRSNYGAARKSNAIISGHDKPASSERAKTGGRRKRTMTEEERRAIADTRQIGACIRCRMQRLKCDVNPDDRQGPCLTCSRVDMSSAKVVHRQPCIRTKLSDVVLYRDPNTASGETWGSPAKVPGPRLWDGDNTYRINLVMRGLCSVPMTIEVRRFVESPGDQVNYRWLDEGSGEVRKTALEPYALVSVNETRKAFDEYVEANAVGSWEEKTKRGDANQLILDHYKNALEHYNRVNDAENVVDQRLLLNFFKLRFALHVSMHPSWVYDRNTKSASCLGMMPAKGDFHPLLDRVPTPPMITEQFNSISHIVVLKYHEQVLEDLEKICCKKIRTSFFTVYAVVFLMLHELAVMTEHHRLDALLCQGKEQQPRQYAYLSYLEMVKKSANILLLHWQYYRRAPDSLCPADSWIGDHITKWFWTGLSSEHEKFCRENWQKMREMREDVRCPEQKDLGSPFYWISQMFEDDWSLEDIWHRQGRTKAAKDPDVMPVSKPLRAKRRK